MKTCTPVYIPPATVCAWLAATLCLPFGMLDAENDDAPPPPKPIPITIVEAKLETREVPAKPSSFRDMAALPGFVVWHNDRPEQRSSSGIEWVRHPLDAEEGRCRVVRSLEKRRITRGGEFGAGNRTEVGKVR